MDRSLYPEGVEVHQVDLVRTEDSKSFHILRRHIDGNTLGVVEGLEVTINTGNSAFIDIASGFGYVPNGELVELESSRTAVRLADATLDVVNVVALVYTETNDDARAHETDGTSKPTSANRSSRLRTYTQSQFDLLPDSDNELSNDAKDRSLIIAKVTAQGSGVALSSSVIENAPTFGGAITIENTTNTISGVSLVSASLDTPNGSGSLDFDFSAGTLEWVAPADTSGNKVNIQTSGTYQLESFPSGSILTVFVTSSLLPGSDNTDTISIQNLYIYNVPRHSSNDIQHRSLVGSGIPTLNNPHGLTLSDLGISGTPIEEHQALFHSNGIRRDSDSTILETIVDTASSPDSLSYTIPGDFYIYLKGTLFISSNDTTLLFTDVVDDTQILFDTYAVAGSNDQTDLEKRERVRFDALSTLTTHVQLRDIDINTATGAGQIEFDDSTDELTYTAPGDSAGQPRSIPASGDTYLRLFSDNDEYIDLFVSSTLAGTGNHTEAITVSSLPTSSELEDRLLLSTVVYSGSATGFIGNGFGINNSPNSIIDKRLFGVTGPDDIRDDFRFFVDGVTDEAEISSTISSRPVGIIDPDYNFTTFGPLADISGISVGDTGLTILHSPDLIGRSKSQQSLLINTQYSNAEDGIKNGIKNEVFTDFPSGTITELIAANSAVRLVHGGTVNRVVGVQSVIRVQSGSTVSDINGVRILDVGGDTVAGADITNQYGLYIEDQTKGNNNYSIYTNDGLVRFGDRVDLDSEGLMYTAFGSILRTDPSMPQLPDGVTNPGSDGVRISYLNGSQASTAISGSGLAVPLPGEDTLLIEKTDSGGSVDGYIIFAHTGSSGASEAVLGIDPDKRVFPGSDASQDLGFVNNRWNAIYGVTLDVEEKIDFTPVSAPSGTVGRTYVNDTTNKLELHNGQEYGRYIPQTFTYTGSPVNLNPLDTNIFYTIPASTLRTGSTIRIHGTGVINTIDTTNNFIFFVSIDNGSGDIDLVSLQHSNLTDPNNNFYFQTTLTYESIDIYKSGGFSVVQGDGGSGVGQSAADIKGVSGFNSSVDLDILVSFTGTDINSLSIEQFIVDIT